MSKTISKSVLDTYFDDTVNQLSPVETDYVRVVKYDEKGDEHIVWEPFDYPEYQKFLGPVNNWTLEALLKAGIDPNFGISTGYPTRLEGINAINDFSAVADGLLADLENNKETKTE